MPRASRWHRYLARPRRSPAPGASTRQTQRRANASLDTKNLAPGASRERGGVTPQKSHHDAVLRSSDSLKICRIGQVEQLLRIVASTAALGYLRRSRSRLTGFTDQARTRVKDETTTKGGFGMDRQACGQGRSKNGPRRSGVALVLVLAVAMLGLAALIANPQGSGAIGTPQYHVPPRPLGSAAKATPFRAGVVLIGFRAGVTAGQRAATERAAGALDARQLGPASKPAGHGRVAGEEYLAPFALRVPAKQELALVDRLRRDRAVAYAEPDYLLSASATPNDTSFSVQWAARNTGQPIATQEINENVGPAAAGTPGADDGAYKAWQLSTGSRSIVIGETDTGVDYTHPDLAANIWSNPGGVGGCPRGTHGYNVRGKNCNPMDEDTTYAGHGTHVAGILGAAGNNGQGVAGMNWQTSILPVKWMNNASHGETSSLIEALQWLAPPQPARGKRRVPNTSGT